MKSPWFNIIYKMYKTSKNKGFYSEVYNDIIFTRWYPHLEFSGMNPTCIDGNLAKDELDLIISKTSHYVTKVNSHQGDLDLIYSDKLKKITDFFTKRLDKKSFVELTNKKLVVKKVENKRDLRHFAEVAGNSFEGFNAEIILDSYIDDITNDNMSFYVGYEKDKPVACAQIVYADNTAGIFWVGVLNKFRNKGYGQSITSFAVSDYINKGCHDFFLIPSKIAENLYEKIGFIKDEHIYSYEIIK